MLDYCGASGAPSYASFGTCHDDLDPNRADTALTDPGLPAVGAGWFYLITGEDASGAEGTPGNVTTAERSNFRP